ncbi:putative methylesterase 12, chloroplastic [Capsicum annuum]|nr:putative methylesterase 12, chloroplastic [Capsicum annuum]
MERSKRRSLLEEEFFHRLALSLAIQQHQLSQRFDGSISKRIGSTSSHRRSDLPDHLSNSKQNNCSAGGNRIGPHSLRSHWIWECKDKPATGIMIGKEQMHGLYFNQSPTKDVALAMVSMRPIPLGLMMDKLSLTPEKYGTSRRFYIQTFDDHALSPDVQEKLVRVNPPGAVFKIKGSDHSPFFSKPQSLHKILVEIAQIP